VPTAVRDLCVASSKSFLNRSFCNNSSIIKYAAVVNLTSWFAWEHNRMRYACVTSSLAFLSSE
jgi:hypothetical protein